MGKVVKKIQCPQCLDKGEDNLAVYEDGSDYCYACRYTSKHEKFTESMKNTSSDVSYGLPARGISPEVCEFFDYQVGKYSGRIGKQIVTDETVHLANYKDRNGIITHTKIRSRDKGFTITGSGSKGSLYGQWKYQPNDKFFITIVEGEIDCLTVAQVQGIQFPVVSVPQGAQSARKFLSENLEYLNGFKHVVLGLDNDEAGIKAAEECFDLFEAGKLKVAHWTMKDPNEMLLAGKVEEIKKCIWNAEHIKVEGIISFDEISVDQLKELAVVGEDLPFPHLSDMIGGLRPASIITIVAREKAGKGLHIETEIPTTKGFKKLKDLTIEDKVFGSDGKPAGILFISETKNIDCYKITFANGTSIVTDREHRWKAREAHSTEYSVYDTEFLHNNFKTQKGRNKYDIPLVEAVEYGEKLLAIDPYTLGLWLGDGTSSEGVLTAAAADFTHYSRIIPTKVSKRSKETSHGLLGLKPELRKLNVLNNKHIPEEYLQGSVEQRMALLQGLMDTDGYITPSGKCEFYNTVKELAENFRELAQSLGIRTFMRVKTNIKNQYIGRIHKDCYVVSFTTKLKAVSLPRKVERLEKAAASYSACLKIEKIEKIRSVPTKCIAVDSYDNTYCATRNYIVTHNTSFTRELALAMIDKKKKVGLLYLEESAIKEALTFVAMKKEIPVWQLEAQLQSPMMLQSVKDELNKFKDSGIYIYDHKGVIDVDSVYNKINFMVKGLGCDIIILDNLSITIAGLGANSDERKSIDALMFKLVKFVNNTKISLINVVHAVKNRKDAEGNDIETITRADVHGSGAFAKFSHVMIGLEKDGNDTVKTKVLANRFKGIEGYADTLHYNRSTGRLV